MPGSSQARRRRPPLGISGLGQLHPVGVHRNLEAGIRVRDRGFGEVLVTYFDQLIQDGRLRRLGAR